MGDGFKKHLGSYRFWIFIVALSYFGYINSDPSVPGMPESSIDRTIDFVHNMVLDWAKNKDRLI